MSRALDFIDQDRPCDTSIWELKEDAVYEDLGD